MEFYKYDRSVRFVLGVRCLSVDLRNRGDWALSIYIHRGSGIRALNRYRHAQYDVSITCVAAHLFICCAVQSAWLKRFMLVDVWFWLRDSPHSVAELCGTSIIELGAHCGGT